MLAELRGLGNKAETTTRDLREEFGRKAVVSESVAIEGDRLSYRTNVRKRKSGTQKVSVETVHRTRTVASSADGFEYGAGSSDDVIKEKTEKWIQHSSLGSDRSNGLGEFPAWVVWAMKARVQVEVDGIKEPFTIQQAMTSKDWPLWAAAIRKEVIGLVAAGLWDEVPRSSVPENVRVNTGHFVFKVKTERSLSERREQLWTSLSGSGSITEIRRYLLFMWMTLSLRRAVTLSSRRSRNGCESASGRIG